MDLLQGIQEIPGQTAGEKFKHINLTAKDIAEKNCQDAKFPKRLEPLLNVEVAKLSHNTKVIMEALITSDSLLCHRALQISDLFTSKDSPLLHWEYFYNQLLSQVSFTTFCKIIKKLETDLQSKDPKVAEEFYNNISQIYGEKQARPLLLACSEDFIFELITKNNLTLSAKNVTKMFQKFPAMVKKYIAHLEDSNRKDIGILTNILPYLFDDHFDLFVSLWFNKPQRRIELGKRRTKVFLKKGKQLLIEKPKTFLDILCLKIVSNKLSKDEFTTMLSNQLDEKMSKFEFFYVREKLRYFPEEKQISILLSAFKMAYGEDLSNHPDLIDHYLLIMLPTELRIKVATMKLEKNSDWNLHNLEESWRVYLPFDKIFQDVKTQIAKRSDANERLDLIKLLILCCKINKNTDSLFELLKYIQVRHKNEKYNIWSSLMKNIESKFALDKLEQKHWDIFIEILQRLELNENCNFHSLHLSYLHQGNRFKLLNKMDPDEYIKYHLKIMILVATGDFNIFLSDNWELQKVYLEKCIDLIEDAYLLHSKKDSTGHRYMVLNSLFNSMELYNKNAEKSKSLSLLKLEDHPSLIKFTESVVLNEENKCYSSINSYVRVYNQELFNKWYPNFQDECYDKTSQTSLKEDIKLLKKDFSQVVSKWDTCIEKLVDSKEMKTTKLFVKALRWYQDLPIKLATHCLSLVNDPLKYKSLVILGILYESSKFQELIEQLVPEMFTVNPTNETSVKHRNQATFYFKGMKFTNPPMPLSFFKHFFTSDYLPLCITALDHTVFRTSVLSVINFVLTSLSDRVAVVKRLINLVSYLVPIKERLKIYQTILHSNTHSSIHGFIILKVLKLFKTDQGEDAWKLLSECIDKRLIEDENILKELADVQYIPHNYLETYVTKMMLIFEKVQIEGCPDLSDELIVEIINQLNDRKYSQVLSTEFQVKLIKNHIFGAKFNDAPLLDEHFIFNVFLHDQNQERIDILLSMLGTYVKTYFGKPLKKNDTVSYPANHLVRSIILQLVSLTLKKPSNVTIINRLLEFFVPVIDSKEGEVQISPYQDMESYLFLKWTKIYITLLDPYKFGIEFGKNLDDWLRSFGFAFLHRMAEIVESFLKKLPDDNNVYEERVSKFVNGLLEVKNENSYITVVMLLDQLDETPQKKYIVEELKKIAFPTVQILVNEYVYGKDIEEDYTPRMQWRRSFPRRINRKRQKRSRFITRKWK